MELWTDQTAGSKTAFVTPHDCLLLGFNPASPGFDWPDAECVEPGFASQSSPTYSLMRHGPNRKLALGNATRLIFDPASATGGLVLLVKSGEKVTRQWDGVAGHAITFTIPRNSILLNNTQGFTSRLANAPDPATCVKNFVSGGLQTTIPTPVGSSTGVGTVTSFFGTGWTVCTIASGISRSVLERNGFVAPDGSVNFRFVQIACGRSHASVSGFRNDFGGLLTTPVNSLEIALTAQPSPPADLKIIAEYSSPAGWKPLSFVDTTLGLQKSGIIHFEPPPDWIATSRWDQITDVGGGAPGSGPRKLWLRFQRRLSDSAVGGVTLTLTPYNLPYVVAKRMDDPLYLDFTADRKGKTVSFRFIPIDRQGNEHPDRAAQFDYTIKGTSFG